MDLSCSLRLLCDVFGNASELRTTLGNEGGHDRLTHYRVKPVVKPCAVKLSAVTLYAVACTHV